MKRRFLQISHHFIEFSRSTRFLLDSTRPQEDTNNRNNGVLADNEYTQNGR